MQILPNNLVGSGRGVREPARQLFHVERRPIQREDVIDGRFGHWQEAEAWRRVIPLLFLAKIKIDRSTADAARSTRLKAADPETEISE